MKNLYLCLLLCTALVCGAQKRQTTTALSLNPTVLASLDHTVMLGVEKQVSSRLVAVLDAGYVFATSHYRAQNIRQASGFSVRPGFKLLFRRDPKGYFAVQTFYKQVNYRLYDWLGKDCINGVPAYEQLQEFVWQKKSLSINLLAGYTLELSGRLLVDFYAGPGIKWVNRQVTEPNCCFPQLENRQGFAQPLNGKPTVNLPAGIKLLVAIR